MVRQIRVMAFDDSSLFLDALTQVLFDDPRLVMASTAADGNRAGAAVARIRPDIITMDVHMPGPGGLSAIEQIMSTTPTPIVVLTADPNSADASFCFEALSRGALEIQPKPTLMERQTARALCDRLCLLSAIPVISHSPRRPNRQGFAEHRLTSESAPAGPLQSPPTHPSRPFDHAGVVGICASTGGPSLLAEVLGQFAADTPWPVVVVQHLCSGFVDHFACWLQRCVSLQVVVAHDNMALEPGTVVLAPHGAHLEVSAQRRARLVPPVSGDVHIPAANRLFNSLARNLGAHAIGVVLTGMGDDGAAGLLAMHEQGALTIAQDGATCTVDGMPRAARDLGAARLVLRPQFIASEVQSRLNALSATTVVHA